MRFRAPFLIVLLLIITIADVTAKPPKHIVEHFVRETYTGDTLGLKDLVGIGMDYYLTESIYISGGTSWAITGNYGGYGTAMLGMGYAHEITKTLGWTAKVMVGAAGHQSLPAGGGLAVIGQTGLHYFLNSSVAIESSVGFLSFPRGDYDVGIISFGLGYHFLKY